MIKKTILAFILTVPSISLAQTVSNYEFIQKQIELISEEADFTYDEINDFFFSEPMYFTTCFKKERDGSGAWEASEKKEIDPRFGKFTPVPKNYVHQFTLEEQMLGFDLRTSISTQNQNIESEKAQLTAEVYQSLSALKCLESPKGCANFYFNTPVQELSYGLDDEEEKVELSKSWKFHIQNTRTVYAEYTVDLSATKKNFLGRKSGTERYTESFLCVLELTEEI